jgi:carboxyl-terminal processing protease
MRFTQCPTSVAKCLGRLTLVAVAAAVLGSCGGGGGSSSGGGSPSGLAASSTLAGQCMAPRPAGTPDPFNPSQPYGDVQGSLATEQGFLRSWIDETYLWYQDVRALPAATLAASSYVTPVAYFAALKTPLFDTAGQPKDKFHFTYDTQAWAALALAGTSYGYGFEVALISASPPRSAVVAYTDSGSATGQGNIGRGATILAVDSVDLAYGSDVATLNAGLFPTQAGPHTLLVQDLGAPSPRSVTVTAGPITETPVQNVKTLPAPNNTVGYMLFNSHIATAESALIAAIAQLKAAGVTDLVLDIRYNGGGYLDIASELAYMIGGSAITPGAYFERQQFNDRNPFNLTQAQATTPFHSTSQGFTSSVVPGQPLPTLNLGRVYVLTTGDTCSASEAIVNGLRGAGVAVNLIGDTTCGKPYGFYPRDNCGTTYFAIQFQGVNNAGFGDYPDGFMPNCRVGDDFSHALGDPAEAQLDMALGLRASPNGSCTPLVGSSRQLLAAKGVPRGAVATGPSLTRNPLRENRIYRQN